MYIFLTILILVASVLLILLVLVQNSKGGGLAAGFSSSNQVLGVRKTTDFLEKATWTLVSIVIFLSIVAAGIHSNDPAAGVKNSEIQKYYQEAQTTAPGAVVPNFGETQEDGNQQ